jgi:hypothetical protein
VQDAGAASRAALKRHQYHAGGLPIALSFNPFLGKSYGHSCVAAMQVLNALRLRWLSLPQVLM